MTLIPGALLPWVDRTFWGNTSGVWQPVAYGFLYAYAAGTMTPQDTFADSDLSVANTNPVQLDGNGRATVFLDAIGYHFTLTDANNVQVWDIDGVSDLAQLYLQVLGIATTTAGVTSGYSVLSTDNLITVNSTGGPNPCIITLQTAADRLTPLTIKNIGDTPIAVTPQPGETIENIPGAPYAIPASATPLFPSILIRADGVSNYWIDASHGI